MALYGIYAKGGVIQDEFSDTNKTTSNFRRVVEQLLYAMPKGSTGQKSYEHEGFTFNYVIDKDLVVLIVIGSASEALNRSSFVLLQKLVGQFNSARDAALFKETFRKELENFNSTSGNNKVRVVQEKLDSVTGIMKENIGSFSIESFLSVSYSCGITKADFQIVN